MKTVWRQIRPSRLTPEKRQLKLQRDSEYEIAVRNLSTPFYTKKHGAGVTPAEQTEYDTAKIKLWNDYRDWAIAEGLYEQVTPTQQLDEAEVELNEHLQKANLIRSHLGKPLLEVKEKRN